jgi:hypothetical protein
MHLCTCMSEEGGDGESACSERHLYCHIHLDTSVSQQVYYSE